MNNEITVKMNCKIDKMHNLLINHRFKIIEKYFLNDIYFIPTNLNIRNITEREILSHAIILRNVADDVSINPINKLIIKNKNFDNKGSIISQNKVECEIKNKESGYKFLEALKYNFLMEINEKGTVYEKEGYKITIKDIYNSDKLIEIEENEKYDSIDKLINELKKLELPVSLDDYFIKKAEIVLKKLLLGGE